MSYVFVTRQLPGLALQRLAAEHELEIWQQPKPPTQAELLKHASQAEGLLCMLSDRIDGELIQACPQLEVIATYAVGYDNIDLKAAAQRGIKVGNTPDVLTEATADLAFALMAASARRLVEGHENVRRNEWSSWEPTGFLGYDLYGSTLGIIGYGRIGQSLERRAQGFNMTVLHTASRNDQNGVPLNELLERSDFVSLHCPLTDDTYHLIDEQALRRMRKTAFLINTARGPIIDQVALAKALHGGWIAGAALDVTDPEPLPADDPLRNAPSLLIVPHIGSATHSTRERMAEIAVDNLLAGLAGKELPNEVTFSH